jgi:membrane fusion protein (multidrug efflux system)
MAKDKETERKLTQEQVPVDGDEAPSVSSGRTKESRWRKVGVAAGILVLLIGSLAYWLYWRQFEDTDDAQIEADISHISARVPGTVTAVHVVDNQVVKAGDVLVQLDTSDLVVALAEARAQLTLAEGQVGTAQHDLDQAEAQSGFARRELQRDQPLISEQVIAQSEFDKVASAAKAASAQVEAAKKKVDTQLAGLKVARARLKQAELNLGYATIVAPVGGIVGKKTVNVGDRIAVGQLLFYITNTQDLWVTANYRETQVEQMRIGQPAVIHVDAVSRDYSGHVESFGGATGSQYSLLPPENASGNYVKVVQRLPVRIIIDPGQPEMDRLRPGMSVEPKVRIR